LLLLLNLTHWLKALALGTLALGSGSWLELLLNLTHWLKALALGTLALGSGSWLEIVVVVFLGGCRPPVPPYGVVQLC